MLQYLERVFPVLSKENNETAANRTWHLYDIINFIEFVVFLMLRSVLNLIFTIFFVMFKFGAILCLTYAFAYAIFYYFNRFKPQGSNEASAATLKLRRPSDFGSWKENGSKLNPYVPSFHSQSEMKHQIEDISLPALIKSENSDISGEAVVRVGSFKRPSDGSGHQSFVGRALADLANIETKTQSKESKNASITKQEVEENKSSNA